MPLSSNTNYKEHDFNGIPSTTHGYAALAPGNRASMDSSGDTSHPRAAAQQSLDLIEHLMDQGSEPAIIPPHERPRISSLKALGFSGSDSEVLEQAYKENPQLVARVSSSAAMWTANAATVAPSCDTTDGRLQVVPANLHCHPHRNLEADMSEIIFRKIFEALVESDGAVIHDPVPSHDQTGDEGAANHMRFAARHGDQGLHVFVHGKNHSYPAAAKPHIHPARQDFAASKALVRKLKLSPENVIHVQQNPVAIDTGIFHNDVIGVNNLGAFMVHEIAYEQHDRAINAIRKEFQGQLHLLVARDLSLEDAVNTYIFNSRIVLLPNGKMQLLASEHCQANPRVMAYINKIVSDPNNPITEVKFFDLTQSMENGGGPACLRLRMVLSQEEKAAMNGRMFVDQTMLGELRSWVDRNYREDLTPAELADPQLLNESRTALDELTQIMELPSLYEFQRG
ncbi:N-succinylarginine dihydrolase [Candidatus Gracilibacteria bacterium]|nr:N-succinylarginine dihydrolase [Candidatus Gracilibacteria bacterium]